MSNNGNITGNIIRQLIAMGLACIGKLWMMEASQSELHQWLPKLFSNLSSRGIHEIREPQ
jgi:hypothetical protein